MAAFFFSLFAFLLFASGAILSYMQDKSVEVGLIFGAAIMCMVFAFLSKFKTFEGMGIKAEMWGDIQKDAEKLVKELRSLSVSAATPVIHLISKAGYFSAGFTNQQAYDAVKNLESSLLENGVSKQDIEIAKIPFHARVIRHMTTPVITPIIEILKRKSQEFHKGIEKDFPSPISDIQGHSVRIAEWRVINEWAPKFQSIGNVEDSNTFSNYSNFEKLYAECNLFTEDERKDIDTKIEDFRKDLKLYCENRQFRRLDLWLSKDY